MFLITGLFMSLTDLIEEKTQKFNLSDKLHNFFCFILYTETKRSCLKFVIPQKDCNTRY